MTKRTKKTITVNLKDENRVEMMKLVLDYEAGIRGISRSQAFYDLIMGSVDIASYPEEIQSELERLSFERVRSAIEHSLNFSKMERTA